MPVKSLDHVNLRTTRLDEMIRWYGEILGLKPGKRPDFAFPGAWLYIGDLAAIHLVAVETPPELSSALALEHFALGAEGFDDFVATLKAHGIAHTVDPVPGFPIVQVNLHDPDGNHIHVDFAADDVG